MSAKWVPKNLSFDEKVTRVTVVHLNVMASACKVLAVVFWDCQRLIHVDILETEEERMPDIAATSYAMIFTMKFTDVGQEWSAVVLHCHMKTAHLM